MFKINNFDCCTVFQISKLWLPSSQAPMSTMSGKRETRSMANFFLQPKQRHMYGDINVSFDKKDEAGAKLGLNDVFLQPYVPQYAMWI